jgi:hypothetical protein
MHLYLLGGRFGWGRFDRFFGLDISRSDCRSKVGLQTARDAQG